MSEATALIAHIRQHYPDKTEAEAATDAAGILDAVRLDMGAEIARLTRDLAAARARILELEKRVVELERDPRTVDWEEMTRGVEPHGKGAER